MMDGLESTLTLFSLASALSAAMNSSVAKVKKLSPVSPLPPKGVALGPFLGPVLRYPVP